MLSKYKSVGWFLSTSILLILSFPSAEVWLLAWIALIPLFYILDKSSLRQSFVRSYFAGFIFFCGTLYWFINIPFGIVGKIGALLLIGYCSLYFGLFGIGYHFFKHLKQPLIFFVIPALWVTCEYLRANLFTGFGWANLSHSQANNISMIQIADMTGEYGVTFVIVLVNLLLKEIIERMKNKKAVKKIAIATVLIIFTVSLYGYYRIRNTPFDHDFQKSENFSVGIVQGNIDQDDKWDRSKEAANFEKHISLTDQLARQDLHLIVWPETSYPGQLWDEMTYFNFLSEYVDKIDIALLFGAITKEQGKYYNSAIHLNINGKIENVYNKYHLVPFGEFLPFRRMFPILEDIVPIEDFTSGGKLSDFFDEFEHRKFATLICFEDTVSNLSRRSVLNGAGVLFNLTNDAWFGDTIAPYMHLRSAIFRTVENRRYLIRAANTGVSAVISPTGKIVTKIGNKEGKTTYVKGVAIANVTFRSHLTFYTKFGDVFTIFCIACILCVIVLLLWYRKLVV